MILYCNLVAIGDSRTDLWTPKTLPYFLRFLINLLKNIISIVLPLLVDITRAYYLLCSGGIIYIMSSLVWYHTPVGYPLFWCLENYVKLGASRERESQRYGGLGVGVPGVK